MQITAAEQAARARASRCAIASVEIAGLHPSPLLRSLLDLWVKRETNLDAILTKLREAHGERGCHGN